MREKAVEAKLRAAIEAAGGRCIKWVAPGTTGVPDRIAFLPGGIIDFIEVKAEGGRVSPQQERILAELGELDANVWVLYGAAEVDYYLQVRGLKPLPKKGGRR